MASKEEAHKVVKLVKGIEGVKKVRTSLRSSLRPNRTVSTPCSDNFAVPPNFGVRFTHSKLRNPPAAVGLS